MGRHKEKDGTEKMQKGKQWGKEIRIGNKEIL